ncbi:hypothetical protein HYH03_004296 [Edaphochlamys debaryana]|uniref:Uncharacterized protein n=1 Tax=Edaphochlamys debaryana TaxID=47281 RepID=A0A835Y9E1_9CHLO|nr:hypothetical protein HYH03_004296 [Edaphochlamys debaryana]|eukprot:KAG2497549.1 hypothetical protein HYH03_004296 [Edaphochlamys debaryana]
MPGQGHEVTFSVGLLEKLAGLRKKEAPKPSAPRMPIQLPSRPPVSPDAARLVAQDVALSRQLQATREVAGLLVKQEAAEVARMRGMAEALLREHSVTPKPLPCQGEGQSCWACFRDHPAEAWRCEGLARAYQDCATSAFSASRA